MKDLPYFFLLMKKNVIFWTIITTSSFSKIDFRNTNTEYTFSASGILILKNYSLSKDDVFKQVWVMTGKIGTMFTFETPYFKYQNNMHYYFNADSLMGRFEGYREIYLSEIDTI